MLINVMLTMPMMTFSADKGTVKMGATVKVAHQAQAIRLASNDVVSMQNTRSRSVANANSATDTIESSQIPAQVWLLLTALFCFVMRSSRRVV